MKRPRYVIAIALLSAILWSMCSLTDVIAQPNLKRTIDSLFIIASSGEVQYRDQNEPAMDAIAALGAPAVPYLIDKFTTKSARERWTIIWTLQRIGSAAVPDLVTALGRDDPLVVKRVAWALGDIKDTTAVAPLTGVAHHHDWAVREQVIGALGKIGDKRADDVAMAALSDSIGQVRKAAAVSCGQLRINESIPALLHRLGDSFYGARMTAEEALTALDTAMVIRELFDSVSSENPLVGNLACDLLGRLATPLAQNILIEQMSSPDPLRRAHAAMALAAIDPDDNCGVMAQFLAHEPDRLTRLKVESARETARHEK